MKILKIRNKRNSVGRFSILILSLILCFAMLLGSACGAINPGADSSSGGDILVESMAGGSGGGGGGGNASFGAAGAEDTIAAAAQSGAVSGLAQQISLAAATLSGALAQSEGGAAGGGDGENVSGGSGGNGNGNGDSNGDSGDELVDLSGLSILTINSSRAIINGEIADLSTDLPGLSAYLRNDKTYVPAEFIEKSFGLESFHNVSRGTYRLKKGDKIVLTLEADDYDFVMNYEGKMIIYLPLRKVVEALDKTVAYYDGLIVLCDGPSPLDPARNAAQLLAVRTALTGAAPVGSVEKYRKLLLSADLLYNGAFSNYMAQPQNYVFSIYSGYGSYPIIEERSIADIDIPVQAEMDSAVGSGSGGASGSNVVPGAEPRPAVNAGAATTAAATTAAAAWEGNDAGLASGYSANEAESGGAGGSGDAYSTTNIQVEGVDESDVVKTDGRYIYQVNDQRILIVDAYPPSGMKLVGRVDFDTVRGEGFYPFEMYVDGDALVVIGNSFRRTSEPYPVAVPEARVSGAQEAATTATAMALTAAATTTEVNTATATTVPPTTLVGATTTEATAKATITTPVSNTATAAAATTAVAVTTTATPVEANTAATTSPIVSRGARSEADDIVVDEYMDYGYDYGYGYGYSEIQMTRVLVYDIKDRSDPKLIRDTEIEGYYVTSRKIDGALYLVANKTMNYYGIYPYGYNIIDEAERSDIGATSRGASSGGDASTDYVAIETLVYSDTTTTGGKLAGLDYSNIFYFPGCVSRNYLIVAGIDTRDVEKPISIESILDYGQNVYASSNSLYVASENYNRFDSYEDAESATMTTSIHRFTLDNGVIKYNGKGDVPGTVLNQFSMDESGGYFRVATTTMNYQSRTGYASQNNLYVLDSDLKIVGKLVDLAPGEYIYSARFMGDRAYVVTFKTVDPLFVIDLSDPTAPKILGALKIPGFSDYLHPYDENHIIGFGKDTIEYDSGYGEPLAYYQGIKIALFDVTDVANPKELFKTSIGDRGSDSELLRNHRALLFSKERELLAFPVTVMTVPESQKTGNLKEDSLAYGVFEFQGAYVYNLNLEDGFTLKGKMTHITEEEYLRYGNRYYFSQENAIERLLYIRESLYALSKTFITSADINTPDIETARLSLK